MTAFAKNVAHLCSELCSIKRTNWISPRLFCSDQVYNIKAQFARVHFQLIVAIAWRGHEFHSRLMHV